MTFHYVIKAPQKPILTPSFCRPGVDVPRPVASFAHFGFDKIIMAMLQREGFDTPRPIQAQAIPAALAGRDVIGIAKSKAGNGERATG